MDSQDYTDEKIDELEFQLVELRLKLGKAIKADELHKRQRDQLLEAIYELTKSAYSPSFQKVDNYLLTRIEGSHLDIDNGGVFFETIEEGGS